MDHDEAPRSRRAASARNNGVMSALEKLKQIRSGDTRHRLEIREEENVYDMVDEDEYSDIVQKRLDDNWIVDDEGIESYVEDGREIFDEECAPEEVAPRGKKRKPLSSQTDIEHLPKKGNIKKYFVNQQKKKEERRNVDVDNDDILNALIDEVKQEDSTSSTNVAKSMVKLKPLKLLKRKVPTANPFEVEKSKMNRVGEKERKPVVKVNDEIMEDLDDFVEEDEKEEKHISKPKNAEDKFDAVFGSNEVKYEIKQEVNYAVPSANDLVDNLEFITEGNDRYVKVYWIDAYDIWTPGVVYFFGKIFVKSINKYVSCSLVVKNVERRVHVLVTGKTEDAKKEFTKVLKENYKVSNCKIAVVKKFYAFERDEVPSEAEYLEVTFPASKTQIPSTLKGESFSYVFGANQSSLERLLLELKFKGPSWIKIKNPVFQNIPTSWCKMEITIDDFTEQMTYIEDQLIPPLTLVSLKVKTCLNPRLNQKEIVAISCLCNNNYEIESGSASKYDDHFCIITKPSSSIGIVLPYDFTTANLTKMKTKTKIFVVGSERELLNFFMAKFGQLDADILVGHDVLNFDLDLIFGRLSHFKYGQWSKLGRFKRNELPHKMKDRIPFTAGRLVCDIKLSSKELIRLKNYELTELVAEILRKNRFEVEQKMMQSFYSSTSQLLKFINFLMVDTEYILSILQELNILPLALQITKIAGNIMSRTLLGGRSERNEFLLLHAFHEKGYILPDKYATKFNSAIDEKDALGFETAKSGGKNFVARHKPAYTGGLVLDPKVGFYDQFILLMDFNSLYPSIIQEYNICFTTVNRKKGVVDEEDEYIPEEPSKDIGEGILSVEIRKLVESRREVKKLLCQKNLTEELKLRYDVKQKALKLTANSMYGCLGFKNSRFYAKPLAALITFKGREILMKTKLMVENMGLEVIYGDTDSIMINTNCDDFDKCRQIGSKIQAEINGLYKLLEIEIDGVFKRMLLLKKKKYACLTVKNDSSTLKYAKEIKGLDVVRRDWSIVAKKAGEAVLEEILSVTNQTNDMIEKIHNYLRDLGERIRNNDVPLDDYVITKQLTKDPEDYKDRKGLTHVTVAVACNESGKFEKKFRSGDTVPYIICLKENDEDDFNKLPNTQRGFHTEMIREDSNLKVDTKYYLSQQVYPVVCRLCDPLEGTDRYSIAEFLGIEDCVQNCRKQESIELDALVIDDKYRFDTCKSVLFRCINKLCGKEFEIRSTFTTDVNKEAPLHLSLEKCPHCNQIFNEDSLIQLRNQLLLFIRSFINDYYQNWMTCEDPMCGHKSRAFTGPMTKRGPLCPRCNDTVLLPEITDLQVYLQIQFLNHIFDLKPYLDKFKNNDVKYSVVCSGQNLHDELLNIVSRFKSSLDFNTINLTKMFEGDCFQIVKQQM